MCGRFTLTTTDDIVEEFGLVEAPEPIPPRYNVAPTDTMPVVTERDGRKVEMMRWGLVPHWADDLKIGARMINARAESLASKSAFRDAFRHRRCLVPADGFFEWKREGKVRTPYYYRPRRGGLFGFAGLWERWRPKDGGDWISSFTIITGEANALVAPIHDRMPVVVPRADYDRWLHPDGLPPEALADILAPAPDDFFEGLQVSTRVNSVANDDPGCIEPTGEQLSLL